VNFSVIDYGAGNLPSVERALERLGAPSRRVACPAAIAAADALILPGVGHYAALIHALDERSLRAPLHDAISRGVPFLGICLGLQALFGSSEEAAELNGLRLLPGTVRSLPRTVKLPHMGWNQLQRSSESRLLTGISSSSYFYFAHSFAAFVSEGAPFVAATCAHGTPFVAAVESRNIFGVQFHPEKSGAAGARVLHNFLQVAL